MNICIKLVDEEATEDIIKQSTHRNAVIRDQIDVLKEAWGCDNIFMKDHALDRSITFYPAFNQLPDNYTDNYKKQPVQQLDEYVVLQIKKNSKDRSLREARQQSADTINSAPTLREVILGLYPELDLDMFTAGRFKFSAFGHTPNTVFGQIPVSDKTIDIPEGWVEITASELLELNDTIMKVCG